MSARNKIHLINKKFQEGRKKFRAVLDTIEEFDGDLIAELESSLKDEDGTMIKSVKSVATDISQVLDKIQATIPIRKEVEKYFLQAAKKHKIETSYDVIAFVSYPNTTVAGIALTGASRIIPGITNKISMEGSNSIKINQSGLYEITVCGRISGVTKDIGGAFYLIKSETSEVLTDMSFILSKGNTEDMDFSEISFVDITAPATLQIKTEIDGDTATSNIEFSSINVLIKGYSV